MLQALRDWFQTPVKLRVTLVMRSGERFTFLADTVEWKAAFPLSGLTSLEWTGGVGAPTFVALTQVDLVYWKRVFRWGNCLTNP